MTEVMAERGGVLVPRQTRRLSDKIMVAFHQACDQGELDVALSLVKVAEQVLTRDEQRAHDRRRSFESLIGAHMRLWLLRHPTED